MLSFLRHVTLAALLSTAAVQAIRPSSGCGKNIKTTLIPGGRSKSFTHESNAGELNVQMKRRVRLYLPKNYDDKTPAPVIIAFHNKHRNGTHFEHVTDFSNSEINENAIVLYPDGIDLLWTGDPYAPELKKNSDIKYAGELLDHIESSFCVDKSRIYAVGFSNGGGLTHLLACDPILSSRIAAFAIASGAFFKGTPVKPDSPFNPKHCKPSRSPVPMIEFHGDDDDMIAYDGKTMFEGPTYAITGWLKKWAERNGCEFNKGEKELLNNGRVSKYNWECGGSDKPILQHYLLHGIGHTWPSVALPASNAEDEDPNEFDATSIIKKFFDAHELPVKDEAEEIPSENREAVKSDDIFEAEFDYAEAKRAAAERSQAAEAEMAAESERSKGAEEERPRDEL